MIKDSELKLIRQLEKEIGVELKELSIDVIGLKLELGAYSWYGPGFSVDKEGDVIGLNLPEMKLRALPLSLFQFEHLEKLGFFDITIRDFSILEKLTNLVLSQVSIVG
ncbi:MAG: hypothetical protein NT166_15060 [Candidatus Aminicenantes bacterium]|nr:hypothetical protein [Candidatus Aminicenantes bacterium]